MGQRGGGGGGGGRMGPVVGREREGSDVDCVHSALGEKAPECLSAAALTSTGVKLALVLAKFSERRYPGKVRVHARLFGDRFAVNAVREFKECARGRRRAPLLRQETAERSIAYLGARVRVIS